MWLIASGSHIYLVIVIKVSIYTVRCSSFHFVSQYKRTIIADMKLWLSTAVATCHQINKYTMSQKSSTSYFAKYFRAGLTDCKKFNGYRVRDNK